MLTIISVTYKNREYLKIQRKVVRSGIPYNWIVVNNDGGDYSDVEGFNFVSGVDRPEDTGAKVTKASHHHALALNESLQYVDTPYVLFLDPDFFVFNDHADIIQHMQSNNLEFFGAPYGATKRKYAGDFFPVAFCMYVDTRRVDVKSFDFVPFNDGNNDKDAVWHDTGHRIYEKYKPISKFEILDRKLVGKSDYYYWGGTNNIFGVHTHAKLHNRTRSEIDRKQRKQVAIVLKEYKKYKETQK